MNDDFLHHLRKAPRPAFAARLRAQLQQQSRIQPHRRAASRVRTFIVLLSLGGAAFAVTMAIRGVPAPILQLVHHAVSPVAPERAIASSPFRIGSQQASLAPAPSEQEGTSAAPLGVLASTPAQSGSIAPSAAEPALPTLPPEPGPPGPWQYFLRRDSAPLLRGWTHPGLPVGWQVQHGVLSKNGMVENLESTRKYRDFELQLEWNIGRGGDSGIFYRATHEYAQIYWTGPEYQLLDDYANVGIPRTEVAGSVFGVYAPPPELETPCCSWNSTRIIVRGNNVEYWLNGRQIVGYMLGSVEWVIRVRDSKFAPYPDYGRAPVGLIGLQGNNKGSLEIRNMRIRELP
jgi:Domain of Unknown Function (DUF1080)